MKLSFLVKNNQFLAYKVLLLFILLGFPFLAFSQAPINTVEGGFKVEKNNTTGVTVNAHGICWIVKNASPDKDYFIPTATPAEWTNFIASVSRIPGVSLASCSQCSSGACCDIATGNFYGPSTTCRPKNGNCDVAEVCTGISNICGTDEYASPSVIWDTCAPTGASGACQINDTGYKCTGTGPVGDTSNPYTCPTYAPANDNVWNATASAWAAKTASLYCNLGGWECNGATPRRAYYGCNMSGGCNSTSSSYENATACSKAEGGEGSSVCVDGTTTCANKCSDTIDNDGDTWIDILDKDCNVSACEECKSGACCNVTTGCFLSGTTTCNASAGSCDPEEKCTGLSSVCPTPVYSNNQTVCQTCSATGASGACQLNGIGYKCTGTTASCGVTNPYNCPVNAPANDNVWNASSWAAKTTSLYCNQGSWECNGATPRRLYYGCNTSGGCNSTSSSYENATACSKAEGGEGSSVCVDGTTTCANKCSDGVDNDGDTWIDSLDKDCNVNACEQCTPNSSCCDSNGCFRSSTTVCNASAGACDPEEKCTGNAATCPTPVYSNNETICQTCSATTGSSGACQLTGTGYKCTGTTSSCGTTNPYNCASNAPSSTPTYPVYNGSSWISATQATNCSLGSYFCNGNEIRRPYYGCVAGGSTCNTSTVAGSYLVTTCGGGENAMCVNGEGSCVNKCSNKNGGLFTGNDDGDGYVADTVDTDCEPQCTSGDCCDTATGLYKPAGTVIGTCGKCTGTSNTSVNQAANEDLGNQCGVAGGLCQKDTCSGSSRACGYKDAGTSCRTASLVCDVADTCSGSSYDCTDNVQPNTYVCNSCTSGGVSGICQTTGTGYKCDGTLKTCPLTNSFTCPVNASTNDNVWNGSSWAAKSLSLYCNRGSWECNGVQPRRPVYGCNTSGSCNTTTSLYDTSTSCSKAEGSEGTSVCVDGTTTCANNCSDTIDNDSDGWIDSLDEDCNASACQDCKTGTCCDSNGCFVSSGTVCNAKNGDCDVAETCTGSSATCPTPVYANSDTVCQNCYATSGTSGACQLTGTGYKCTGNTSSCGTTNPFNCTANAPTNDNVWNASSWAAKSTSLYCNRGAWSCDGTTPKRGIFGCNTSGGCNTTTTLPEAATACTKAEGGEGTSVCVDNTTTCANNCSDTIDNDNDGYKDSLDKDCNASACEQCTSGDCCDSNGCYKSAGTICGTGSCGTNNYGSSGSCVHTYTVTSCSGNSATCNGSQVPSGNNCYCSSGTVFNGSTCATVSADNYCNLGSATCVAGYENKTFKPVRSCNGSTSLGTAACKTTDETLKKEISTCAAGQYCVSGTCQTVACTINSHCGAAYNSPYTCDGNSTGYYRMTPTCTNNTCSNVEGTRTTVKTCGGRENSMCRDGYSSCQDLCSNTTDNDGDGWVDGADTDCCGTAGAGAQQTSPVSCACGAVSYTGTCVSGRSLTDGYRMAKNAINQSYDQPCPGGTYGTNGCCGSVAQPGYYSPPGSTSQTPCPAGTWCPGGLGAPVPCPYVPYGSSGSYVTSGASSCSQCPYDTSGN